MYTYKHTGKESKYFPSLGTLEPGQLIDSETELFSNDLELQKGEKSNKSKK